jgi:hypothetical protein
LSFKNGQLTAYFKVDYYDPNKGTGSEKLTYTFNFSNICFAPLKFLLKITPIITLKYSIGTPLNPK